MDMEDEQVDDSSVESTPSTPSTSPENDNSIFGHSMVRRLYLNIKRMIGMDGGVEENVPFAGEKHPLFMKDPLGRILQHLDTATLKNCRLVCKFWRIEASKPAFECNFIRIPSNFHKKLKEKTEEEKNWTMEKLRETFSSVLNAQSIIIGNYQDIQVLLDLNILGKGVKHVKINSWFHPLGKNDFESMYLNLEKLLKNCPMIEFLDTREEPDSEKKQQLYEYSYDEDDIYRPLTKGNHSMFGLCLMYACCKLKKDNSLSISEIHVGLPKNNSFCLSTYETFSKSKSNVHITSLNLKVEPQELQDKNELIIITATNKILESNKEIMTHFRFASGESSILSQVNFPVMPNLQKMELLFKVAVIRQFFHPDFRFSVNCPNLHEFRLQLKPGARMTEDDFSNLFASTGPALSVKRLEYVDNCRFESLQHIFEVFSAINELSLFSLTWFCYNPPLDFFTNLKRFIVLDFKSSELRSCRLFLYCFTGFDFAPFWRDNSKYDKKIINPSLSSIVRLKDLRQVIISLPPDPIYSSTMNEIKLSTLLKKFVRDFMPKKRPAIEFSGEILVFDGLEFGTYPDPPVGHY